LAFKIPVEDDVIQSGWKIVALFGQNLDRHQLDFPGMLATDGRCENNNNNNNNNKVIIIIIIIIMAEWI